MLQPCQNIAIQCHASDDPNHAEIEIEIRHKAKRVEERTDLQPCFIVLIGVHQFYVFPRDLRPGLYRKFQQGNAVIVLFLMIDLIIEALKAVRKIDIRSHQHRW